MVQRKARVSGSKWFKQYDSGGRLGKVQDASERRCEIVSTRFARSHYMRRVRVLGISRYVPRYYRRRTLAPLVYQLTLASMIWGTIGEHVQQLQAFDVKLRMDESLRKRSW